MAIRVYAQRAQPSTVVLIALMSAAVLFAAMPSGTYAAITKDSHKDISFAVMVDPGEELCFYEDIFGSPLVTFEFEVVSGRNLDIDFSIVNPNGKLVEHSLRQPDGDFEVTNALDGTWKVREERRGREIELWLLCNRVVKFVPL
eukprot:m.30922 g.30922  ORF g.30922 m.30922 type:complete len:144 (-) comp9349_c0_seq4:896-1327(-)